MQKHISIIKKKLDIKDPNLIIPYSSESKMNKDKIWAIFKDILEINETSS